MTTEHDGHTIAVGPVTTSPPTDEGSQPFTGHATLMATLATWRKAYDAQRSLGREHHPMTGTLAAAYDAYLAEPTTDRDWHTNAVATAAAELRRTVEGGETNEDAAQRILDALGLHGWPHTYQPDSPHVAELRRLRAGIQTVAEDAQQHANRGYFSGSFQYLADSLRALLADSPETAPTTTYSDETGNEVHRGTPKQSESPQDATQAAATQALIEHTIGQHVLNSQIHNGILTHQCTCGNAQFDQTHLAQAITAALNPNPTHATPLTPNSKINE